jgi:protein arginine kinase activator
VHCEHCHDKEASIHLIMEGADGQKRSVHLCLSCALKTGLPGELPLPPGELAEVLKQFGDKIGGPLAEALKQADPEPPPEETVSAVCPECGTSDAEFRRRQRLGCPACYEVFEEELRALLPSLHRKGCQHRGRGPLTTVAESRERLLRLQRLKQQLVLAVAAEAYERASLLRDEITQLEAHDAGEATCP